MTKAYRLLRDKEWLVERLETEMPGEIADEIGCSSGTVYYWMKRHRLGVAGVVAITDKVLKETFRFIVNHWSEHQTSPSIREITEEVGYSSTSMAAIGLGILEDRGKIRREPRKARQIFVVGGEWVYHGEV